MQNIKNAIINYLEKYGKTIATMGVMMTGDVMGAIALQEMDN